MKKGQGITVLKIGGSVITDKGKNEGAARYEEIERIAREISEFDTGLVIVHGAGSFGHPQAKRYELNGKFDPRGSIITHLSVKDLNKLVVSYLNDAGVNAIGIHPMNCVVSDDARIKSMFLAHIQEMIDRGFVPVLHGDVVMDERLGTSVLSGDQIVPYLAFKLKAERIGIGSAAEGVLDGSGKTIGRITPDNFDQIKQFISGSANTDVTGGMLGKVLELLNLSESSNITSYIFNAGQAGNVSGFLSGEDIGTAISKAEY
ncbi:isopentenyl phosphate kinase [Methanolobus halotolerans]|uniref:Isopentenyl phosphate kinase n=1 Tax=Methanolobus halotolerans TaxID=2052935 RepID=A0A4E0Q0A1_9EURY|nr:isopentenyl phosphate kinase [Methanolobus halotolerans]TGC11446.1 amino acid kinase [Methanolobus halotolerans]